VARVLVVDDSGMTRRMLRKILEEAGHEVLEAADGPPALERYSLDRPDVVLLDLTMEEMFGLDVLEILLQMDADARFIITSADVQRKTREMAEEAGAVGYVTKPLKKARSATLSITSIW